MLEQELLCYTFRVFPLVSLSTKMVLEGRNPVPGQEVGAGITLQPPLESPALTAFDLLRSMLYYFLRLMIGYWISSRERRIDLKDRNRRQLKVNTASERVWIRVLRIVRNLFADIRTPQLVPPGHFYSPIPSVIQMCEDYDRIFSAPPGSVPGIELDERGQLELLDGLAIYYPMIPFIDKPSAKSRYYCENEAFTESDAALLYCMFAKLLPQRVVEIGCGFSSAAMLDTCDELDLATRFTFIEPYPDLLKSRLRQDDYRRIELVQDRIQKVDLEVFDALQSHDILFIDSTHVTKTGSDVNFILFQILPRLRSDVYIHFHDIFYPFEYPAEWVLRGRAWNEIYLLRAFLAYNNQFRIVLFNSFLQQREEPFLMAKMPRCLRTTGGSLWLRKL
jgi:hypothetical protein